MQRISMHLTQILIRKNDKKSQIKKPDWITIGLIAFTALTLSSTSLVVVFSALTPIYKHTEKQYSKLGA